MPKRYNQPKYELTPDQLAALDLLLSGHSVIEASAAVGVTRETVGRWRNSDPAFQAAYNTALQSAYEASQKKLLDARARAIGTLDGFLDGDDKGLALKAAAALLRVEIPQPTGRTDPYDIARWDAIKF